MRQVGSFEAKTHFSELLEAVLHGQSILITRRGEPVAMLVPPEKKHKQGVKSVIADLRQWREGITWGKGISISVAKEEGRR